MTVELVLLSRVSYGSAEITGSRLQDLLALLAEDPHVGCSAARLLDALWSDELPEHPSKALQVLVARARARLGPGVIVSTPAGYRLSLREDQIDASAVLFSASESEKRSRAGDHLAALGQAEAGLKLCDSAADWGTGDGRALSALRAARVPAYRSLLRARALALSRLGRRAEAAGPLGELILRSPRDEEVLAELLRCEAVTAGPAVALARYADYRQRLREELGSDPGLALRGVHQELLLIGTPVIRRGIRPEPNPLLGRDQDISAVAGLLRTSRVTSIVGSGGLGKTRLAHAVASQAEQRVVHVVEFTGVAADGDVTAAVASALGVGDDGGNAVSGGASPQLPAGIVAALGPGPALLVLDNCEHVVRGAAELVHALVSLSRDLRVLTTSRAPLGLSSESVYLLPELDLPTMAELFRLRARAARPDVGLPAQVVRELCGRLDGLPLAAELAAARVRVLSVAEIAGRLDDRFAVLRGSARDAPQRHRTLHAVIDWSWSLLDPAGQEAMRALSVFPGGFTVDAAGHLLGGSILTVLEQLADHSLLKVVDTPSGTRHRMLEAVREFAAARREEAGETEAVSGRFLAWARDFGVAHHDSVLTLDDLAAFELVRAEQDNLAQALRQGLDHCDAGTVAAVSAVLGGLWMAECNFARVIALAGETARILPPFRPEAALVEATRTSLVLGAMSGFVLLGGPNPARFLAGLRRLPAGPPDTLARAAQAVLAVLTGSPEADVAVLDPLGDSDQPLLAGIASYVVAYSREAIGDQEGALAATRRALPAFERCGSAWLQAAAHSRIGEMCLRADEAGHGDTTVRHLSAALSVAQAFGAWSTVNRVRALIVGANLQRGALDLAERELELTTRAGWNAGYLPMFDTAVRAEIALGGGDADTGLRLWRAAAAALWDPRLRGPGGELCSLPSWALEVQAIAVIIHAQRGQLGEVAEIADALPAALAALTADPGPLAGTPAASYPGLSVWGTLLLALAMADLDRGGRGGDERAARSGARMVALAERFGFQHHGFPTMSAGRARRAAQAADGPAYADAVSSYADLGPEALRAATRTALAARVPVSG